MEPGDVSAFMSGVTIRNAALRGLALKWSTERDRLHIVMIYRCAERDNGHQTEIVRESSIGLWKLVDVDQLRAHVRDAVRSCFVHEFEECYFEGGQRVLDPHAVELPPLRLADPPSLSEALAANFTIRPPWRP